MICIPFNFISGWKKKRRGIFAPAMRVQRNENL
jgi:hypothetical protein